MDFNIIFWTVILLLMGFSTTRSQSESNMTSADSNNTNSTTTCATPDTSTAISLPSTGSPKTSTNNDSDTFATKDSLPGNTTGNGTADERNLGEKILDFIISHWLYFAIGGGCLILVIIALCVICCSCRRSKGSLKRQLSKHKSLGNEETKDIPNGKLVVENSEERNRYSTCPSVGNNYNRTSNYDLVLDINKEVKEDKEIDEQIEGVESKVCGSDSSKENGNINESSQNKPPNAPKDNYYVLEKTPSFDQNSSSPEAKKDSNEHAQNRRSSEVIYENRPDGTYDILHVKPKRVNQSTDKYEHVKLPNLTSFKKDGGTHEAEARLSDTYDHVTSRKRDVRNDYEYAQFQWEKVAQESS